jgi:5'-nucleotidase (lipoprotein e(P4) family)
MIRTKTILFLALISLFACKRTEKPIEPESSKITQQEVQAKDTSYKYFRNEYMVLGTLYHQQAAEYKAMCYQAYNLGKLLLDKDLSDKTIDKHRIIVLDIDETVLDNSPYQAECILENISYPTRWDDWCKKAEAKAIPGSLEFLLYARSNGVSVFYITNRKEHLKAATIQNLVSLGFPMADEQHVIMRTDENSKEGRRQNLADRYHISILFGDNLNDFTNVFEGKSNNEKLSDIDRLKSLFGNKFVVLPNSMYGEWELSAYSGDKNQSDSLKFQARRKALTGF